MVTGLLNTGYMSEHCADACREQAERDQHMAAEIGEYLELPCLGAYISKQADGSSFKH